MRASHRLAPLAATAVAFVLLSGCSILDDGSGATLAPLNTATTSTPAVSIESTTTTSTLAAVTTAPTTTIGIVQPVVGPFPTSVPTGRCSAQAIGADFGTVPQSWVECAGAWAVTRIQECPPETECEGLDIFRWTAQGWVHRGMTYSLCVLMVDETGMPRAINDRILAGNSDCIEPIVYVNESVTAALQVGAKGPRTRRIQQRLIEWKLLDDSADGYFGANTRNAVFDFQHLAGLAPTGEVDQATMLALGLTWP